MLTSDIPNTNTKTTDLSNVVFSLKVRNSDGVKVSDNLTPEQLIEEIVNCESIIINNHPLYFILESNKKDFEIKPHLQMVSKTDNEKYLSVFLFGNKNDTFKFASSFPTQKFVIPRNYKIVKSPKSKINEPSLTVEQTSQNQQVDEPTASVVQLTENTVKYTVQTNEHLHLDKADKRTHKYLEAFPQARTKKKTTSPDGTRVRADGLWSLKDDLTEVLNYVGYMHNGELTDEGVNYLEFHFGEYVPNINGIKHWSKNGQKELTLPEIYELITTGTTLRACVKEGGNSKDNITSLSGFQVDFDLGNHWDETINTKWGVFANFWYTTPSYDGKNNKHRLWFTPDRVLTDIVEIEAVYRFLIDQFRPNPEGSFDSSDNKSIADESCKDAGRLFYGCWESNPHGVIDFENKLPVDVILEECREIDEKRYFEGVTVKDKKTSNKAEKQAAKKGKSNQKDKPSKTRTVDQYIDDEDNISTKIDKYFTEEILNGVCDGDVEEYYCLYEHNFKKRKADQSNGKLKYDGANPFSATDSTGGSFTVMVLDDNTTIWRDRSEEKAVHDYELEENKDGGRFIDYWISWHQLNSNEYKFGTQKEIFKKAINNICSHFGVDNPTHILNPTVKDLVLMAISDFSQCSRIAKWVKGAGANNSTFFYTLNQENYFVTESSHHFASRVLHHIKTNYSREFSKLNELAEEEDKTIRWRAVIRTSINNDWSDEDLKLPIKYKVPTPDSKYLPFANGLFNLDSKVFETNIGQANNSATLESNYTEYSEDDYQKMGDAVNFYLKELINNPDSLYSEYLKNYWICLVHGRARETETFPYLYGALGTGKSSYSKLIVDALENFATTSEEPLKGTNHGTTILIDKYVWVLEELEKRKDNDLRALIQLYGDDDSRKRIDVNEKFEALRQASFGAGLIADTEDAPMLGNVRSGIFRRAIFIEIDKRLKGHTKAQKANMAYLKANKGLFLQWLLKQDVEKAIGICKAFKKSDEVKAGNDVVRRENSSIAQFVHEAIEITNDDTCQISNNLIMEIFKIFHRQAKGYEANQNIDKIFVKELKREITNIGWDSAAFGKKQKKLTNKYTKQRFYATVGIRIKPEILEQVASEYYEKAHSQFNKSIMDFPDEIHEQLINYGMTSVVAKDEGNSQFNKEQ